jgi:hypothetical protein
VVPLRSPLGRTIAWRHPKDLKPRPQLGLLPRRGLTGAVHPHIFGTPLETDVYGYPDPGLTPW